MEASRIELVNSLIYRWERAVERRRWRPNQKLCCCCGAARLLLYVAENIWMLNVLLPLCRPRWCVRIQLFWCIKCGMHNSTNVNDKRRFQFWLFSIFLGCAYTRLWENVCARVRVCTRVCSSEKLDKFSGHTVFREKQSMGMDAQRWLHTLFVSARKVVLWMNKRAIRQMPMICETKLN